MGIGLLGKKLGMTQVFHDDGRVVPVTVIKAGPCYVIQKKTETTDGYNALQLGFEEVKKTKKVTKPLKGHFDKVHLAPLYLLKEFEVTSEEIETIETAAEISVGLFDIGEYVDVTGISKGKGFAGVVKKHGFKGAPASRGTHEYFRHGGSIGQNMTPGRTMKGKKMPGHMGARKVTIQNLKVVEVRGDANILMVEGAIPGPNNGYVLIKKAIKKR